MEIGPFELHDPIPELREPRVIASLMPWLDAGSVGRLVLSRLQEHCHATDLGGLAKPGRYFDFTRYRPFTSYEGSERVLKIPNTTVWHARSSGVDFLFINVLEPHLNAEEYIDGLADLFRALGVHHHCRVGAWYDAVPHTRPLAASYSVAGQQVDVAGRRTPQRQGRYQGPTSIMNQLTDRLEKEGIENAALTLRLPNYSRLEEDHSGVAQVLRVLTQVYSLPDSLRVAIGAESAEGVRQYQELSEVIATDTGAQSAVRQLEELYDGQQPPGPPSADDTSLSPEIEKFLNDMSNTLGEEPGPSTAT